MSVASHLCDAQAHVIIKLKWNKIIAKQMESGEVNLAIHFVEFELNCVWKSSIDWHSNSNIKLQPFESLA